MRGVDLSAAPALGMQMGQTLANLPLQTQQAQLGALKIGQEKQAMEKSAMMNSILSQAGGDLDAAIDLAKQQAPQVVLDLQRQKLDQLKTQAETRKTVADAKTAEEKAKTATNKRAAGQAAILSNSVTGEVSINTDLYASTLASLGEIEEATAYKKSVADAKKAANDAASSDITLGLNRAELLGRVYQSILYAQNPAEAWEQAKQTNPEVISGEFPGTAAIETGYYQTLTAKDALSAEENFRRREIFTFEQDYLAKLDNSKAYRDAAIKRGDATTASQISSTTPIFKDLYEESKQAKKQKTNMKAAKTALEGLKTDSLEDWKQTLRKLAVAAVPDKFDSYVTDIDALTKKDFAYSMLGELVIASVKQLGVNPTDADRDYIEKNAPRLAQDPVVRNNLIAIIEYSADKKLAEYSFANKLMSDQGHFFGDKESNNLIKYMETWEEKNPPPTLQFYKSAEKKSLPQGISQQTIDSYKAKPKYSKWSEDKIIRALEKAREEK